MAKEHFIIQISICDYDAQYGDEGYILRTNSTGDVIYTLQKAYEYVSLDIGPHEMIIIKRDGNEQLIDLPETTFVSEEYAATLSELQYSANAPYGSLVIISIP